MQRDARLGEPTKYKQVVNVNVPLATHSRLRAIADFYGASIHSTILRYIRDGLERDYTALEKVEKGITNG